MVFGFLSSFTIWLTGICGAKLDITFPDLFREYQPPNQSQDSGVIFTAFWAIFPAGQEASLDGGPVALASSSPSLWSWVESWLDDSFGALNLGRFEEISSLFKPILFRFNFCCMQPNISKTSSYSDGLNISIELRSKYFFTYTHIYAWIWRIKIYSSLKT